MFVIESDVGVVGILGREARVEEATVLTREQLYDLVWTTPLSKLAVGYAISDVGLKKLCARHGIPTPPRGYWAQRAAGRKLNRPKLPASKEDRPIHLQAAAVAGQAMVKRDSLKAAIAEAKSPENSVLVADRLRSPSLLVREAKDLLEGSHLDDHGLLERPFGCLDVRVSRAQLKRALRIVDALIKASERRGWKVVVQSSDTFVYVNEVAIALTIEEGLETVELPVKPELTSSYSFHYNRRETRLRPSGYLTITLREPRHLRNYSQQRNWREYENRALEDRLTYVIIGLLKLSSAVQAAIADEERDAREAAQRRRHLQEALEKQQSLREALAQEMARTERLLDQAARWRKSQSVRLFIEEVRKHGRLDEQGIEGEGLAQWISWAVEQADRLDPFSPSPPSILDDAERVEHMADWIHDRR